jgi:hypothetical protein
VQGTLDMLILKALSRTSLGRTIRLGDGSYSVIGVLPGGNFPTPRSRA